MKKINLLMIFFFVASIVLELDAAETHIFPHLATSNPFFKTRIEAGYSAGQLIGIKQSYAELGLFIPICSTDALTSFVDCRGYRFNNAKWGISSGIGLRKCLDSDHAVGANAYYDYLEGNFHKSFNRLGFGLEWLGECLDFRINTYLPVGHQTHSSETVEYNDYTGNYRATCRENQFSIGSGFDAEIGGHFGYWNNFTLYGGIGPYCYLSKQESNYFGGQARIEASYHSLVSIQIRSSYDSVNQSQTQAQIQISIPFEILSDRLISFCENTILQPVRRNGVIFTDDCCDYKWNW